MLSAAESAVAMADAKKHNESARHGDKEHVRRRPGGWAEAVDVSDEYQA